MTACLNVYEAFRKRAQAKNWVELARNEPDVMRVINYVMELRRAERR